jgi:hypothetical protein
MPGSSEQNQHHPAPAPGDDDDKMKEKDGKGSAAVAMASATRSLLHALPRHLMKDTMKKNAFWPLDGEPIVSYRLHRRRLPSSNHLQPIRNTHWVRMESRRHFSFYHFTPLNGRHCHE